MPVRPSGHRTPLTIYSALLYCRKGWDGEE